MIRIDHSVNLKSLSSMVQPRNIFRRGIRKSRLQTSIFTRDRQMTYDGPLRKRIFLCYYVLAVQISQY